MNRMFENQAVLITGGASGIGRATALAFALAGARVMVSDIAQGSGEETVTEIRAAGGQAHFVLADVSSPVDVTRLVEATISAYGRLDVAFNNAGIDGVQAAMAELPIEVWNRVLAINLTGTFLCMQQELRQMERQRSGTIINNASILGSVAFPGASAYTAAKHGLLGLTRTAALEYASKGIRVNAVCPGFVVTPMLERAGVLADLTARRTLEGLHPMQRLAEPEEVAEAVLFLASSKASFITGHPLVVDGGYVAR